MVKTSGIADEVAGVPEVIVPELYSVYGSDDRRPQPEQVEWVIKGTDGTFYLVSAEPGG